MERAEIVTGLQALLKTERAVLAYESSRSIRATMQTQIEALEAAIAALAVPVAMVLFCPCCGTQHVDTPTETWDNPPHRSHLCESCGHIWRPADIPTVGVVAIRTRGKLDSPLKEPPIYGVLREDILNARQLPVPMPAGVTLQQALIDSTIRAMGGVRAPFGIKAGETFGLSVGSDGHVSIVPPKGPTQTVRFDSGESRLKPIDPRDVCQIIGPGAPRR